MKKKILITPITVLTFLLLLPILKPEIKFKNKLIILGYDLQLSNYEVNSCYDESYFYNKENEITITSSKENNFLFLDILVFSYKEGNLCKDEYTLSENYITNFLENAKIKENPKNINLANIIKNKTSIISNKRYTGNDYNTLITYTLNNKHQIMYIFTKDDLLIIQVGNSDEAPKFIAYK